MRQSQKCAAHARHAIVCFGKRLYLSIAVGGSLSSHCHIKHTKRLCLSRSRERRKFKTYSESRHSGFHAKGVGCYQRISESRYPTTSDLERGTAVPRFFCFYPLVKNNITICITKIRMNYGKEFGKSWEVDNCCRSYTSRCQSSGGSALKKVTF